MTEEVVELDWPLPKSWTEATLEDVAVIERGITFPASEKRTEYFDGGIVCLRTANVQAEVDWDDLIYVPRQRVTSNRKLLRQNDILISMANSYELVGKVSYVGQVKNEASFGGFIAAIRSLDAIEPKFLFYQLRTNQLQSVMRRNSSQTVNIANLSLTRLYPTPVRVAPLSEQQRIVAEIEKQFTRLDAAVGGLKRIQANLERYKASVLKAACEGRLVPQEADLNPDYEPADRLLERILEERRRRWEEEEWQKHVERAKKKVEQARRKAAGLPYYFRDMKPEDWMDVPEGEYRDYLPKSDKWKQKYEEPQPPDTDELPELPEGWVWAAIGYLFDVKVGSTPSRREPRYWNGDIPWVSSGEVAFSRIKQTEETISPAGLNNSSVRLNPPGTVLLAMIGEGKTRGQAAILDIPATNNQNAAAILCADSPIPSEWVFYWLMARYEETRRGGSGGMQPALNSRRVGAIPIPVPPQAEMDSIVHAIEEKITIVEAVEQDVKVNILRTDRFRQSILQEAFSGRLVPQDPDDEPASVLLKRIRSPKSQDETGAGAAVHQPSLFAEES